MVFAGRPAAYVEAVRDPGPAALARRCPRTPARGPKLAAALDPLCRRVSIADAAGKEIAGVLYLLREDRDAFRLFICNTGYTAAQFRRLGFNEDRMVRDRRAVWPAVKLRGFAECAGAPQEWDPATGRRFAANAARTKGGAWEIATDLPALGQPAVRPAQGKNARIAPGAAGFNHRAQPPARGRGPGRSRSPRGTSSCSTGRSTASTARTGRARRKSFASTGASARRWAFRRAAA